MTAMQCTSCKGLYDTVTKDGSAYFHACPSSIAAVDRRNENVPSTAATSKGQMTAPGKGAIPK